MAILAIQQSLRALASPTKAKLLAGFFKTGKGEYGEGDQFLGLTMPEIRKVARQFWELPLNDVERLLASPFHEERMAALLLLVFKFQKGDEKTKKQMYTFYLSHTDRINNWDLVDVTTPHIVGTYVLTHDRTILKKLSRSTLLWDRRIAMLATFPLIRTNQFDEALALAEYFLQETHDLMHKAVGWMLREVGNRDRKVLRVFLDKHTTQMPRTMLRYAIEKFPEPLRQHYLTKK